MAVRVNAAEVKEIINTNLSDVIVSSSIDIASRLVDDVVAGNGPAADRLPDIELYLSAHLIALRDQDEGMTIEQDVGDAKAKYSGRYWMGLNLTRYGQMAIVLDTSGRLAGLTLGKPKALFTVVAPIDVPK